MDILGTRSAVDSAVASADVVSRAARQAGDLVGAYSGYGSYCPEGIPIETAIFAILGAFGVAFGVLYRAVTLITAGRRKKRSEAAAEQPKDLWEQISYKLADIFWWGNYHQLHGERSRLNQFRWRLAGQSGAEWATVATFGWMQILFLALLQLRGRLLLTYCTQPSL